MDSTMDTRKNRELIKSAKRIVVKVGTGVVRADHGLDLGIIDSLASQIAGIYDNGVEVILVSSGAVGAGMGKMGMEKRPEAMRQIQALAAIGQSSLMRYYEKAFEAHAKKSAQILLTRDDLAHRRRYLNARNTLTTLLSWKCIPIINENDTVVVDELKFGDNDNLAAQIAHLMDADLLISLSDIDGLYTCDPKSNDNALLLHHVDSITKKTEQMACELPSAFGTGGMTSKIKAAKKVTMAGIPMIMANGKKHGVLAQIMDRENIGTFFLPSRKRLTKKKCWIAWANKPKGVLMIDKGAALALTEKNKSLLPVGVIMVEGNFGIGDTVEIINKNRIAIGLGLANYSAMDIIKIKGKKSGDIVAALGYKSHDDVVHRDNLVIIPD